MTTKSATFTGEFHSRLDSIIERGKAAGLNLSDICKKAGVARATPDRWKAKAPKTIQVVDQLEAAVAKAEREASK
ncbi:hypothetical protein K32_48350 [Kaistia sp. 32K]|nr:hypothetical protein K32_48350 [Kaistia sp. 32K]